MRVRATSGTAGTLEQADLDSARQRSRRILVSGAALGSTAVIGASTVAVIAARDMLGDTALAGAAASAIIVGTALGTSMLAALMVRRGQRVGLSAGYAIAVVGALIAAAAVISGSLWTLVAGTFLIGFASSSTQLSRYASAEMAPPERRASAIGLVVWAATIGAVVGPTLVPVSASISESMGLPGLTGPFVAPALFTALAGLLLSWRLRPDPDELAVEPAREPGATPGRAAMSGILRRPAVAIAVSAMVVAQVVMVVIMSMTPLHMIDQGHELGAVGLVISAHTIGMFALSPVSGRLAERIGNLSTILLSVVVLAVAALLAAAAPADGGAVLLLSLFLLGHGWNLGFVAGSALLTSGVNEAERTRTQGFTDSLVWGSSAVATLGAGIVLAMVGFSTLGLVAAVMLVIPVLAVLRMRHDVTEPSAATGPAT